MLHMWIFFQLKKCFTTECDFIECPKKGKFFFLILALSVSLSVEQKLKPYKDIMLWWLCGNIKIYFDVPYIWLARLCPLDCPEVENFTLLVLCRITPKFVLISNFASMWAVCIVISFNPIFMDIFEKYLFQREHSKPDLWGEHRIAYVRIHSFLLDFKIAAIIINTGT